MAGQGLVARIAERLAGGRYEVKMLARKAGKLAKHWSIYLREGEEGLGRYLNQNAAQLAGGVVDAGQFSHPRLPRLLADIEEMAAAHQIPVPRVVINTSVTGSPLSAGYGTLHIDPSALEKYGPDALRAFAGHELSHIKHKDVVAGALGMRKVPMENRADIDGMAWSGKPGAFADAFRSIRDEGLKAARSSGDRELMAVAIEDFSKDSADHPALNRRIRRAEKWAAREEARRLASKPGEPER